MLKQFIFWLLVPVLLQAQKVSELKTYSKDNYSIQYAANWDLNTEGQMGTTFVLFSKPSSANDKFRENVNLMVQDLSGYNVDLDTYAAISEQQLKSMVTAFVMLENKKKKDALGEYQHVIYKGEQGNFKLTFEQHYRIINNKAYVLTFTAEQTEYDKFKPTTSVMFNSFKLNK